MADRSNERLNREIERQISLWKGTAHGEVLRKSYQGEISYEGLCDLAHIDMDEYTEEVES